MSCRAAAALLLLSAVITHPTLGQEAAPLSNGGGRAQVFAGGELENYLRYLQTLGEVGAYPWGVRAFSPGETGRLMPRDTLHPWADRYEFARRSRRGLSADWIAPTASVRFNSTFPFGYNDGPIWAGRGFTVAGQAGVALRWGVFSVTLAPMFYEAGNAAFPLQANGQTGRLAFADGVLWSRQSTARVDWGPLTAGGTTANQYWGPATEFPIILGNNAPGFPHVFFGTSRPANLWLLRLHFRFIWGRLSQSGFSPETEAGGLRYASGLDLNLTSRWLPGLEIGLTRFSHQPWPAGGLAHVDLLHILRFQSAANSARLLADNQLASAYFRWVLPRSGFEVYGEYGRDDYNGDLRDLIEEPDHIGGYTIGLRKVMRKGGARLVAVRAELQNLQFSLLASGRSWQPFYTHGGSVRQGHTQLGQVLGSVAGPGGAGSVVAVDSYSPSGRWTFSWTRIMREQRGNTAQSGVPDPKGLDVQHELAVERLAFRGRYDLLAHVGLVYEFNRNFKSDAFDLNVALGARLGLR